MSTSVDELRGLLPEYEAVVYDRYSLCGWAPAELTPEKTRWLRGFTAKLTLCKETVALGLPFLTSRLGGVPVRSEWHEVAPGADEGHALISIPASYETEIAPEDIVVDATYLQFARNPKTAVQAMPLVFVGKRSDIIELMLDETFSQTPTHAQLYEAASLTDLIVRHTTDLIES